MIIPYKGVDFTFSRYPTSSNRSLKPWSALDEHLLNYADQVDIKAKSVAIYNDRFGALTSLLHAHQPFTILNYKSQEKAVLLNLEKNKLEIQNELFLNPLEKIPSTIEMGLFKIPKSMDLFRLQLHQLSQTLKEDGVVFCSFMTKYFTPQMISIAKEFFGSVEQSKAWKKSRVIILQTKKERKEQRLLNEISFEGKTFHQYFGVFSGKNIDFASQFFIEHFSIKENTRTVLDLASGNGVLAYAVQLEDPMCEIHLMDDSFLAIESSKLNLENNENTFFHYSDSMDLFEDDLFDLVVSNPPFHFEYETNIEVAIKLFHEVERCLKAGGSFQLVASRHLNFKTHLEKIFSSVHIISENNKFIIYECLK